MVCSSQGACCLAGSAPTRADVAAAGRTAHSRHADAVTARRGSRLEAQSTALVDVAQSGLGGETDTAGSSGQQQAHGTCAVAMREAGDGRGLKSKLVEHALFVLSNLATGDESVISEVMDSGVPALLPRYLAYSGGGCSSYGAVSSMHTSSAMHLAHRPIITRTQQLDRVVSIAQSIAQSYPRINSSVVCVQDCGMDISAAVCCTEPRHSVAKEVARGGMHGAEQGCVCRSAWQHAGWSPT